jgi:aldehyde dehydrogenase (NAD+)
MRIHTAMDADFRKASQEVDAIEIFHVLNEIKEAGAHLEQWTSPKKVDAPLTMLGTRSVITYEPKGVCLIIAPWNYPFSLTVGPLVSALAAGNSVIVKPSEMTPNVARLLKDMAQTLFPVEEVALFEGDAQLSQELLKLPFDHIFFTGSPTVGKIVMKAAAENLTSVTLELGGKSPTIVCSDANLREAAERIAVGKFVNNGQTCIAPDYVLVHESVAGKFTELVAQKTKSFFAEVGQEMENSTSYCRVVNDKHFTRLTSLLEDAVLKGAKLELNGKHNPVTRFMHPVIVSNVSPDARILEEEIFGPILPVLKFSKLEEAIAFINARPKPLALYVFTRKKHNEDAILASTSSGGVCINDCGIHFLHHKLPFGGVNHSGIGKSHGHEGFLAFSNQKPVLRQRSGLTSVRAFYPPYTNRSRKLMDWFLKFF